MEQRVNLKFLVKLGKTFAEAYAMLKEVTQVLEWFKRFKEGRETTEDGPRPVGPQHRRLSIQRLAEITGTDKECVRQILHESFNMRKVCAKIVPKLLTPEEKESRMNICVDILNIIATDPGLLDTVISGDEMVFYLLPQNKAPIHALEEPELVEAKKASMSKSKFKAMMIVYFDIRGIVYVDWVTESQTVNRHNYIEVLKALREHRSILMRPSKSISPSSSLEKSGPSTSAESSSSQKDVKRHANGQYIID
ncbi:hypothetical protein NQ318_022482 [Aromia moschata]|uniref:Uncharacterized protein n=1 Tax=Aromia moschata TaxID=1265417 RepID=A0AAV8Z5P0_9CUCU|nr:hypothetical protein NQ318_022482 [Aromia moschata]